VDLAVPEVQYTEFLSTILQVNSKIILNLKPMSLEIVSNNVNTKLGVPLTCIGIAQVKIGGLVEPDVLQKASENFLSKETFKIQALISETMEGHQRAIIGTMTVEEIY